MAIDNIIEETVLSADHTIIGYHKIGNGPALIVVHGTLRSATDYERLARYLSDTFTVYLMDRRGRGKSGAQGPDYSFKKEREDIIALLQATSANLLFGHSFGGAASLETVLTYKLTKLAVYEPAVSIDHSIHIEIKQLDDIESAIKHQDYREALAIILKIVGGDGIKGQQLEGFAGAMLSSPMGQHIQALIPTAPAELKTVGAADTTYEKYQDIKTETLFMHGSESTEDTQIVTTQLMATVPNSKMAIVSGAGHNGPDNDAPKQVADLLKLFFGNPIANPS